ncbi:MAG: nucleotidyltransferase family protein [Syntrophobacteraceae bacterium]
MSESLSFSQLTAVVLAGGLGTRLRSVMPDRPKVLAEVRGRPFLAYLLDQLERAGIRHVVLSVGYLAEQVQRRLGASYGRMKLEYSCESSPLGTAGGLKRSVPLLRSSPVLVLNGDSYCSADLPSFYERHRGSHAEATILLTRMEDVSRYGCVELRNECRIVRFHEKHPEVRSGLINAGVYLLSRALLDMIPPEQEVSLEREMFPIWITQNIQGVVVNGPFLDIGTPESFMAAEAFFASLPDLVGSGFGAEDWR